MKDMLKTIGWTALAAFSYYLLEVLFNAVFRLVLRNATSPGERMDMLLVANLILKLVLLLLFGFWYMVRENKWRYHPDYRHVFTAKTIFCLIGIGLLGQYAIGFVVGLLKFAMPDLVANYEKITSTLCIENGSPLVIFLLVVVIGPIAEELLFRGVIYGRLRNSFTVTQAAVISAAIFGIYHKNIVQGLYAAFFGIILAYIFEKTQTIWGCTLMHMAFNVSAYLVKGLRIVIQKIGIHSPSLMYLVVYMLCVVVVILCIRSLRRLPNRYDEIKKRMEMLEG